MWAIIPFHVGQHYGDVGRCLGGVGQPGLPPLVWASSSCLMFLLPLLFHPHHLGSEWLPVAFWNRRVIDFLDDVCEVLQAGDRGSFSGVEHGDILAGTSEQDGPRDLLHGNATSVHVEGQLFIGG